MPHHNRPIHYNIVSDRNGNPESLTDPSSLLNPSHLEPRWPWDGEQYVVPPGTAQHIVVSQDALVLVHYPDSGWKELFF